MRGARRAGEVAAALLGLVLAWGLYAWALDVPSFVLPGPAETGAALLAGIASGQVPAAAAYTLSTLLCGFAAGAIAGIAAGFGLARWPAVERWLGGPILFLQTAPKIALAPLFVIWFGLGATSKIVLVASLVVFPVLVGTLAGLRAVDPRLLDLARLLRLTPWQGLRRIEGPAALPEIFVGLKVGAVQAVVGAVLGEWMSGRQGLGALMTFATATYKTPLLFAAVLTTAGLGILVYAAVEAVEGRLLAWREIP